MMPALPIYFSSYDFTYLVFLLSVTTYYFSEAKGAYLTDLGRYQPGHIYLSIWRLQASTH
jgi:hypothetical protein